MLNYAYTIEYSMCKCILSISSTFHCNYVPILYCFWGNQLSTRVMTCSWNSGLGVIKNGTIRQIAYELLLFHIHSNYGHILYHFRDKAKYWSKIAIFSYRICIHVPIKRDPIGISTYFVWKTSIVGLPGSERSLRIHRQNTRTWRTSRQSNSTLWHRPHHAYSVARQKLSRVCHETRGVYRWVGDRWLIRDSARLLQACCKGVRCPPIFSLSNLIAGTNRKAYASFALKDSHCQWSSITDFTVVQQLMPEHLHTYELS